MMTAGRIKYTIYLKGAGLIVCPDMKPCPDFTAVAKVLVADITDAQCLADYLWVRVLETYPHLLRDQEHKPQLIRGLTRRFVHKAYAGSTSIQAYPLVPEYLSDAGETKDDDS